VIVLGAIGALSLVAAASSLARSTTRRTVLLTLPKPGAIAAGEVTISSPDKPKLTLRNRRAVPRGAELAWAIAPLRHSRGKWAAFIAIALRRTAGARPDARAARDVPLTFGLTGNHGAPFELHIERPSYPFRPSSVCSGSFAGGPTDDIVVAQFPMAPVSLFEGTLEAACHRDDPLVPGMLAALSTPPGGVFFDLGRDVGLGRYAPIALTPFTATSLAADFDGTGGQNDIAVIDQSQGLVFVLLNVGTRAPTASSVIVLDLFTDHVVPTSASAFRDARTGLDDLAISDVAQPVTSSSVGRILVGRDSGAGDLFNLAAFRSFVAGPGATNLLSGDFNADGFDDLAYVDFGSNFAAVALNDGTNFFLTPQFRETGGFIPVSAAIGDFNDDDNLDLAVLNQSAPQFAANRSAVTVLGGEGTGAFTLGPLLPLPALSGLSTGPLPNIEDTNLIQAADLNGEALPDLVVATKGGIQIFENHSTPGGPLQFTPGALLALPTLLAGTQPVGVVVQDVTGDHRPDILALDRGGGTLSTFVADPRSSTGFDPPQTMFLGPDPVSVTAARLNSDAFSDIAVLDGGSSTFGANLLVFDGTHHGFFSPPPTITPRAPLGGSFTASPSSAVTHQAVGFHATGTGGSGRYGVSWSFGDGTTGTGLSATHAYGAAGTYPVTANIVDLVTGEQVQVAHDVAVSDPQCDTPPSANIMTGDDPDAAPSGSVLVQVIGACLQYYLSGAINQAVTAPSGDEWYGLDVHTPSRGGTCGGTLPVATLVCQIKPSGRICWHLYGQPDVKPGDVIRFELQDAMGTTRASFDLVVGGKLPSGVDCPVGDNPP
jgi:hypothetical protein